MFATNDHRYYTASALRLYQPDPTGPEQVAKTLMVEHLFNQHRALWRDCFFPGHFTSSAWVVNPGRSKVLLVKLPLAYGWQPIGGHANGDGAAKRVAERELKATLSPAFRWRDLRNGHVFDLEIYSVPPTQVGDITEPEHLHFDIRFAFEADDTQPLASAVGGEIGWFALSQAAAMLSGQTGLERMLAKTPQQS